MFDEVRKLWTDCPEESRQVVLADLRGIQRSWESAASDRETEEDAETLGVILKILETLESASQPRKGGMTPRT